MNIDSFVYIVSDYSQESYSYGLGLGYKGSFYSGLFALSQVKELDTQYKGEFQLNYNDGKFIVFTALSLRTDRADLGYKIGAGYPLSEKSAVTSYISDKGFFVGFRRTL